MTLLSKAFLQLWTFMHARPQLLVKYINVITTVILERKINIINYCLFKKFIKIHWVICGCYVNATATFIQLIHLDIVGLCSIKLFEMLTINSMKFSYPSLWIPISFLDKNHQPANKCKKIDIINNKKLEK